MAAAEEIDEDYDAPDFGIDKSASKPAEEQPLEKEEAAEEIAHEEPQDDGAEPAIVEDEEEQPAAAEEAPAEEYVNISNPEDDGVYDAPQKPATPQEQMQQAIDSIEKRSKYLDEPNVMSDEAIDDIVSQISFFGDDE